MKKSGLMVLVLLSVFFIASFACAQEDKGPMGEGKPDMGMMREKMGKDAMKHGMMMPMMMSKQMVASNDGGVIVLAGKKLYKYDKNLVLVKEVEIKVDAEGMNRMMGDMKAGCPMMERGEKGAMSGDDKGMMPEK